MKSILCFIALVATVQMSAQTDTLVWRYADITVPLGGFIMKSKVDVDYGESITGFGRVAERLEDETGKQIKFKSAVDALNWMSERGWELTESYQSEEDGSLGTRLKYQHFIMRRQEPKRRP